MAEIKLPGLYRYYVNGETDLHYTAPTVGAVLEGLAQQYPALTKQLFTPKGDKKRHINIFVNKVNIKELDMFETAVNDDDVITVLPNISGG